MPKRSASPDVPKRAGGAALGARLRRLSDRIDREAGAIYATNGLKFEQRWFGVMQQLHRDGDAGVAALAHCLGVTHVAISQTRKALEENGLVITRSDPADARRSVLSLSEKGRRLANRLVPTWEALTVAAAELNAEAGDVVAALDRLERALAARSLSERVVALLAQKR